MAAVRDLVFLGASTAFSEIAEVVRDINALEERYRIVAVLDDDKARHGTTLDGVQVHGALDEVARFPDAQVVFGIGSFRTRMVRESILRRLALEDDQLATLVHPAAKVYRGAAIGAGSIIHFGAVVADEVSLGRCTVVTFNAVIGPGCRTGRCAMVTTAVTLLSGVELGAGAFVGAASCVAERVRIGPGAMVGMGTHVYRDVRPGAYILGSPPREISRDEVPPELLDGWQPRTSLTDV